MADITSLVIYRRSANFWELVSNLSPEPISRDAYRGSGFEPYVSIQSSNGTTVVNGVSVSVVSYIDEYGSNSTPSFSSASELMQFLKNEGFFESDSNGGSGATVFTELNDVPSNYFGNQLKLVRVNADGTGLEFVTLSSVLNVDLQEVTDVGNETSNDIVVSDGTVSLLHGKNRIVYNNGTNEVAISFTAPTANRDIAFQDGSGTIAFTDDIRTSSLSFGTVVSTTDTIQDDRLIGLDDSVIEFPFSISADNSTWTEFDGVQFSDMAFDNSTGTITGFPVSIGKKVFLTLIK